MSQEPFPHRQQGPQEPPNRWGGYVLCYSLLAGLLVAVLVQGYLRPLVLSEPITVQHSNIPDTPPAGLDASPGRTVDPNTADWAELTYLPQIGEAIAKRIVAYRQEQAPLASPKAGGEQARVFTCPEDLAAVRGIGPKTLEAIAPYLRFTSPAEAPGR